MDEICGTELTVLLLGLSAARTVSLGELLENQGADILTAKTVAKFSLKPGSIPIDLVFFPSSLSSPQLARLHEQLRQEEKTAQPYFVCTVEEQQWSTPMPGLQGAMDLFIFPTSLPVKCLQIRVQAILKSVVRYKLLFCRQHDGNTECEDLVHERTTTLARFIEHLKDEMQQRRQAEKMLQKQAKVRKKMLLELQGKNQQIQEANVGLRVLLDQHNKTRQEVEERITDTLQSAVRPYIELLRLELKNQEQAEFYLDILSTNLNTVLSSFTQKLHASHLGLTSREIQVADLVRQGHSNKEIATLLHLTPGTIESYRNSLRRKLGLRGKKINLRTYLLATFTAGQSECF